MNVLYQFLSNVHEVLIYLFQTALSIYFQEAAIPKHGSGFSVILFETSHSCFCKNILTLAFPSPLQLITPANTPATPPNFPDALTMFSNMSTSDNKMATSPLASSSSLSPRSQACMGPPTTTTRNSFSPVQTPHFPPQSNFEHQQKNQPQSGFIQPPNPWRGQTTHQSLGSGTQTPTFGINCDQNQVDNIDKLNQVFILKYVHVPFHRYCLFLIAGTKSKFCRRFRGQFPYNGNGRNPSIDLLFRLIF